MLLLLRETRQKSGLTQIDFAEALGKSQSFVSKCERGETRIDVIQLRTFCRALGADFPKFIAALERRVSRL
ncbi:MAG: helix-turn-helix transcriptional regulator [Planctomycetales bacterium]|nr:helix-turn-helix transcriptional regulator [Planctomycetales bacterium]